MSDADGHSTAGKSIIEMLWTQADIMYAKLMEYVEDDSAWTVEAMSVKLDKGIGPSPAKETAQDMADYWELRGKLGGLAYSLGRMLHTYEPPKVAMDKIREELRERWESVQEEDEED